MGKGGDAAARVGICYVSYVNCTFTINIHNILIYHDICKNWIILTTEK